jgi:hypothetical protein
MTYENNEKYLLYYITLTFYPRTPHSLLVKAIMYQTGHHMEGI